MDRTYIAIDVETTGLEPGVDEIIEVAAVKFRGAEVLETFAQLIQPRHSVPLKISRLTGITPAMLANQPRFSDIAPDLARFIKSYPLIGHSVGFDIKMLQAQSLRLPQTAYDTYDLATLLVPEARSYSLGSIAAVLGISLIDAHRAHNDADVTRQVFLRLIERIHALDLNLLAEINAFTARLDWPLREFFTDAERERARTVFITAPQATGGGESSIRVREATPLRPTGDSAPISLEAVRQFFAPDGPMGQAFDGYEQREPQVQMSTAVADALNDGEALLVEAGTGTGKGMAYLVPAVLHAVQRGERVVISTNTINLQDQLFFKDIPALQRLMRADDADERPPFTAALLKGRGNYLCLRRYKDIRRDPRLLPDEIRALLKVQLWMPSTSAGDRAELSFSEREAPAWNRISAAFDMCNGPRCPDFNSCYFFKARKEAEAAHLVVVNHALMLADMTTEAQVLPPYDRIVIDEAHNLEDVATDQFSFEINRERLVAFLDDLYQEGGAQTVGGLFAELPRYFQESAAAQSDLERASEIVRVAAPVVAAARTAGYDLFNLLTAFIAREAEDTTYDPRIRLTPAIRRNGAWSAIERAWDNLSVQLAAVGQAIDRLQTLLKGLKDADIPEYDVLLMRVDSHNRFALESRLKLSAIIMGGDASLITWMTNERHNDSLLLSAAPLSVAELLQTNLFEQKESVILTSATMSVGGRFDYIKERIGLPDPRELQLESPFDYKRQSLIYIPQDIPEPNHPGYQRALEQALVSLCTATGGRALVLFTANSALRQTYRAIQEPLEDAGIAVLGQGLDGSRRAVLERFKESPRTVLLGTTSFWEGVDIIGDALSVLVIAKLPFSVPNDPIYAARSEQLADSFSQLAVPQAILRFKQGFGRLIRSREDRGIVAVLDRRVISKKYGQTFLESLPPTNVRTGPLKQLPVLAERLLNQS